MSQLKKFILLLFNIIIFIILILKFFKLFKSNYKNSYKIFFGGARSGNIGGTLTKIKKLKSYYGESLFNFNIVYLMSNTPYLSVINLNFIKKLKIPIIHNQNGLFYPSWYKGDYLYENKKIYNQYIRADFIFFQSIFCKKISLIYLGYPKCKNIILYNAVDTKFYLPKKSYVDSRKFSFLITGKFNYNLRKSLISSIESIKKCKDKGFDFKLNIHGHLDNALKDLLLKKTLELSLTNQINFNGPYIQENANLIYNNNDAFLFLTYKAPCSNSVLEALSSGLPVIYSNSGGTNELVNEAGIGLDVEDNFEEYITPNITDIKSAMIKVFNKHYEKSQKAREVAVQNFNIDNWYRIHSQTMKDLLNEK